GQVIHGNTSVLAAQFGTGRVRQPLQYTVDCRVVLESDVLELSSWFDLEVADMSIVGNDSLRCLIAGCLGLHLVVAGLYRTYLAVGLARVDEGRCAGHHIGVGKRPGDLTGGVPFFHLNHDIFLAGSVVVVVPEAEQRSRTVVGPRREKDDHRQRGDPTEGTL